MRLEDFEHVLLEFGELQGFSKGKSLGSGNLESCSQTDNLHTRDAAAIFQDFSECHGAGGPPSGICANVASIPASLTA